VLALLVPAAAQGGSAVETRELFDIYAAKAIAADACGLDRSPWQDGLRGWITTQYGADVADDFFARLGERAVVFRDTMESFALPLDCDEVAEDSATFAWP